MAYYNEISQRGDLVERAYATLADYFHAAAARHAARRIYRTTFHELNVLSNRDLADLGIHRSEIKRLAWEAAEKAKAN